MKPARLLAVIVAGHFLIGLLYLWATPIFEASDEGAHFGVIRWISEGRGLPVQDAANPRRVTPYHQEGSQPPLYYLLGAGLTFWMPAGDYGLVSQPNPLSQVGYVGAAHNVNLYRPAPPGASGETARIVLALRLFSLLLSGGTVALTYALARRAGASAELALLAAALAAFNPMALFINASVNNDNLLMLLSTAALWVTLDTARQPAAPAPGRLIFLGTLLGLAALTKVSGLVLWPMAGLGLAWGALFGRWTMDEGRSPAIVRRLSSIVIQGVIVLGVAGLISGWWFWRNWQLYGELLGTRMMVAVAGPRTTTLWALITQEWYGFYLSFWGVFGAFTVLPGVWAQWVFHGLTSAALVGLGVALIRARGRLAFPAGLLLAFCALTLFGVIQWTLTTPASQGRLLFGALAPLALGLAVGLRAWFPALWARPAALAWGGALLITAILTPLLDIAPHYAPPQALTAADLPADLRPVHAQLGAGMELVGYTSDNTPRRPGEAQRLTLYWRAVQAMDHDYALALVLLGRGTQTVGKIDTWPGAGRLPTGNWAAGAYYADPYELPLAADAAAPTLLKLNLGGWDGDPGRRLTIQLPAVPQTDSVTVPVGRLTPRADPAVQPAVPFTAQFENDLNLLGYTAVQAGTALTLTLYWRAAGPLPADYTVFAHFVDGSGAAILPPADAPPVAGDWPTSAWLPNQTVIDERVIALPAAVPAGCCDLQLGWYDPASGARLTAARPDGAVWPDNAVLIPNVIHP